MIPGICNGILNIKIIVKLRDLTKTLSTMRIESLTVIPESFKF